MENLFRVVFTAYSSKYTTNPRHGVKVISQSTNGVPSGPATLILYAETGETIAVVFYCTTKWDSTSHNYFNPPAALGYLSHDACVVNM